LPTNPQIHLECNAPARVLLKNNDIVYNYSPALGTSIKIYLIIYNNNIRNNYIIGIEIIACGKTFVKSANGNIGHLYY
jgi:hypothetical protein